jgi:thioredoxin 1
MLKQAILLVFIAAMMCLGASACARRGGGDEPPVFDKRPYAEAKKAAEDGKMWFIVKATASWCGPCQMMNKTTWRDEGVVKWIGEHAIAVSLDVDEQPKTAQELGIEAMPTMIAFKDGKEFDRIVGYRDAGAFLAWLEGLAKGEKSSGERDRAAGRGKP